MRRNALILLALAVLSAAVFAQTRGFEFINYDDPGYVTAQPELLHGLSWDGLRWVFTTIFGGYIPVTGLSFLTDYEMHGLDAGGYHLTNVVLHTLNGVLLFLFLARTTAAPWASAIVAALFLVHPLRAESVAWISSRKDLTCGLFWMLTLHAYASYAKKPRIATYALVFAGICLALLSKPMAVTLPCVLLLLDVWPLRRFVSVAESPSSTTPGRIVLEKIPLFIPVVAASLITFAIQRDSGAVSSVDLLPIGERLANAVQSYAMYIALSFAPSGLIPLYPYETPAGGIMLFAIVAGLAAISLVALFSYRRYPWVFTGWFWYAGTLVPVIGLVQVGAQAMADRYTYLSQIGLLILIVWSIRSIAARAVWARAAAGVVATAAIATYAVLAHAQTACWRDSVTLWSRTVDLSPNNAIAHSSLGEALLARDDREGARRHIETALAIKPEHRPALVNLAKLDVEEGRLDDALRVCQRLVEMRPDDPDAHTTWSSVLIRRGKPHEALAHTEIALHADPNHADALINHSAAMLLLGRAQDALVFAQRAARLAPDDPAAFINVATANFLLADYDVARRYCTEALRLDPDYEPALALRGDLDALAEP